MAKEQAKVQAKEQAKVQAKELSKPGPQTPMNPFATNGGKDNPAPRRHARTSTYAGSAKDLTR